MFQHLDGKYVYVVELVEKPTLPIHDGGSPLMKPYAEALDAAVRQGIVKNFPGKYAVEVNHATNQWNVYRVDE